MTHRFALLALAGLLLGSITAAQEGFPLNGTWRGIWGEDNDPQRIVVIMKWNGTSVTGQINPGPNSMPFSNASLNAENWTVRIEVADRDGETILIEGQLEEIGSFNRYITGTWSQAGSAHPFRITRE